MLTKWIQNGVIDTGIKNVVFTGGVALNVKANMKICNLDEIKNLSIPPGSGDESICIGTAYQTEMNHRITTGKKIEFIPSFDSAYLGASYSDKEIEKFLNNSQNLSNYEINQVTNKDVAELLANGEIVARFVGRMNLDQDHLEIVPL